MNKPDRIETFNSQADAAKLEHDYDSQEEDSEMEESDVEEEGSHHNESLSSPLMGTH